MFVVYETGLWPSGPSTGHSCGVVFLGRAQWIDVPVPELWLKPCYRSQVVALRADEQF